MQKENGEARKLSRYDLTLQYVPSDQEEEGDDDDDDERTEEINSPEGLREDGVLIH